MRFEADVKVTGIHSYARNSFSGYGVDEVNVYTFQSADTTYVWKTTSYIAVNYGAEIRIVATFKKESEYNGQPQTEITRVKVLEVYKMGKTAEQIAKEKEERREAKAKEQRESLSGEDFIYTMPYRQYKEHYSDCETVCNSYNHRCGTIDVIIREGRLKNSGSRF